MIATLNMILGKLTRQLVSKKLTPMGFQKFASVRMTETVSLLQRGSCPRRGLPPDTHLVCPPAGDGAVFWQNERSKQPI
jgi:hypothetical protein